MLRMRLPAAVEGDSGAAVVDGERRSVSGRCGSEAAVGGQRELSREAVFEWFGLRLSPARRVHFLAGLLHMCQPLELRFLGSCLEDLARKDYHVLREVEARANSAADLRLLTDVADPVVLSHLLVCLPLLGSKNRECATVLYSTLSRVCCTALSHRQGEQLEQLALLFAMASLHPAFTFHQRELIRAQLDRVDALLDERNRTRCSCTATAPSQFSCPDDHCSHAEGSRTWPSCPVQHLKNMSPNQVVHIQKLKLKEVVLTGDGREYSFDVRWSDSSSTAVTKSHRELQEFLMKLCKEQNVGGFEQDVATILNQTEREHRDLEKMLRARFSSVPQEFLQMCQASGFFLPDASSAHCTHCNSAAAVRGRQLLPRFSEDCSETSSLEEDLDVYRGSRSHGVGNPVHGSQWESSASRRSIHGEPMGRRRHQEINADFQQEGEGPPGGVPIPNGIDDRSALKTKGRPVVKRDRLRRGTAGKSSLANGIQRVPAVQMINQAMCKASGRDTYGDTSSESSNSVPSSPIHHQRSLENQDAAESQSDNSVPEPTDTLLSSIGPGKKAVAMVNPLVTEPERACPVTQPMPAVPTSAVVELALTSCLPYALQYSTGHPDVGKPGESKLTITIPLGKQDPRAGLPVSADPQQCPLQPACPESLQPVPTGPASGKPCLKAAAQPPTSLPSAGLVQCPLANTVPTLIPSSGPVLPASLTPTDGTSYSTCSVAPSVVQQQTGCNTCGCRGTCGGSAAHQSPTSFFLPAHPARQLFAAPTQFFPLAPHLCSTSFPTQNHQGNGTPLSFYTHTSPSAAFSTGALLHAHSDHLLTAQQPGYTLPQVTPFGRFYPPVFPPVGAVPGNTGLKKSSSVSCYNCGMSGHYAQDCKQPSMDAGQPGGFQLKYVVPPLAETLDKAD